MNAWKSKQNFISQEEDIIAPVARAFDNGICDWHSSDGSRSHPALKVSSWIPRDHIRRKRQCGWVWSVSLSVRKNGVGVSILTVLSELHYIAFQDIQSKFLVWAVLCWFKISSWIHSIPSFLFFSFFFAVFVPLEFQSTYVSYFSYKYRHPFCFMYGIKDFWDFKGNQRKGNKGLLEWWRFSDISHGVGYAYCMHALANIQSYTLERLLCPVRKLYGWLKNMVPNKENN